MMSLSVPSPTTTVTVFAALQQLPDPRDNRGKRHDLAFVLCGVILAIMAGRSRVSAIHRFLRNRFEWLRELTQATSEQECISRAQLPRVLARVEWTALQPLLGTHLGIHVESPAPGEWIAIDGKALRGSPGEQVVLARSHHSGCLLAHQPQSGPKRSEVTTVRALLAQPLLAGRKVSLDALHCTPLTTAQIHQAHGGYVVQVKANQRTLLTTVRTLTTTGISLGTAQSVDKAHGRLEVREATFFSLAPLTLPRRWQQSGLSAVVRVARTTTHLLSTKQTHAVAYYLTNQEVNTGAAQAELSTAIRGHWGCEADNWVRDVTLQEDQVPVHHPTQAHVLGLLRTLVLGLFRKARAANMRALLDDLADSPARFTQLLRQVGFL
jgi:predicted transposase YbfD/YdcC